MKHYLGVSLRSIKRQKMMSVLTIIAVSLSVAMVLSLFILGGSIKKATITEIEKSSGRHHMQVQNLTAEQTEKIKADNRVAEYGFTNGVGQATIAGRSVSLMGIDENAAKLLLLKLMEGNYPSSAGEIILEKRIIENMELPLSVPQTVSFPVASYDGNVLNGETAMTFTLVGILENHSTGVAIPRGWCSTLQSKESPAALLLRYKEGIDPYKAAEEIMKSLDISKEDVHINNTLLDAIGASESGMNEGAATGIIIGGLVLILACFVIMNIFNVSVIQRKKQFAMLRCIGASVGQVRLVVISEAVLLSAVGTILGLIIGIASANGIVGAAGTVMSPAALNAETQAEAVKILQSQASPSLFSILLSIGIGVAVTVFSTLLPSFLASRTAPVYALSNVIPSVKIKRRKKEERAGNILWFNAKLNLSRNKRRTMFTVITLTISMVIFIAITSFASTINPLEPLSHMMDSDFTLGASESYVMPLDPQNYLTAADIEIIRALPGVERVKTVRSVLNFVNENKVSHIFAYDNETLQGLLNELGNDAPTLSDMENQLICLTRDKTGLFSLVIPDYKSPLLNDSVSVFGQALIVAGVLIGTELGPQYSMDDIIVTEKLMQELTDRNDIQRSHVFVSDNATAVEIQNIRSTLKAMQKNNQSLVLTDFEEVRAELEASARSLQQLAYGLVAITGIIGILSIINTMYTSIHARMSELGTCRAIGETNGQMIICILFEGMQYGVRAILIGIPLGILMSAAIVNMTTGLDKWSIPFIPAVLAAVCVVSACMASTLLPLRRITNRSIVESIGRID